MNRGREDMRTMSRLFEDPVHRLFEIHHPDPGFDFANGGLQSLYIQIIGSLLLSRWLTHADRAP